MPPEYADSRSLDPRQSATLSIEKHPAKWWTVAHTRPRCEKLVLQHCQKHGVNAYLPLRRRTQRYQRRNVITYIPMFPGYLFVQIDSDLKNMVLRSNRVARILPIDEPNETVLIRELNELRELELSCRDADVVIQPEIVEGRPVRVSNGPMKGVVGVVTQRRGVARVTVNIEMLGQSASVDVDIGNVEIEE